MHVSQNIILNRENQVILLMITDGEKWHYLAVKSLSASLIGITSKHTGDFYRLNYFRANATKSKLKIIKAYAKIMIIAM